MTMPKRPAQGSNCGIHGNIAFEETPNMTSPLKEPTAHRRKLPPPSRGNYVRHEIHALLVHSHAHDLG
jgi:hypothetical protein